MAFTLDMAGAARRHLLAADILAQRERRDVAGYLYGIAAECAIKAMMLEAGMGRPTDLPEKNNPLFVHFPELRTMLRDSSVNRRAMVLSKFVKNDAFMNNWSIRIRYAARSEIDDRWISKWAEQAHQAVASIGT
jgi:hypothetical protein